MTAAGNGRVPGQLERIESLVMALEASRDAAAREQARELVRAVLELHAAALAKMLELAAQPPQVGQSLIGQYTDEPLVAALLLLHGLHPVPPDVRVARALERFSERGDVELLAAGHAEVRLRLRGDRSTVPALRHQVQQAIAREAPDIAAVVIEEVGDQSCPPRIALPLLDADKAPIKRIGGESGHD
jgi:hypothetical protein